MERGVNREGREGEGWRGGKNEIGIILQLCNAWGAECVRNLTHHIKCILSGLVSRGSLKD